MGVMTKRPTYRPISRDEFLDAWRNLRISKLWIGRAATADHRPYHQAQNSIGFLSDVAQETHRQLKSIAKDMRLKRKFCRAAGLSGDDFDWGLKVTAKPDAYAFAWMSAYNNTNKTPVVTFTVGASPVRRYVRGRSVISGPAPKRPAA